MGAVYESFVQAQYIVTLHMQVTDWSKEDYGKFYNGDSYIVLNTYKKDTKSPVGRAFAVEVTLYS